MWNWIKNFFAKWTTNYSHAIAIVQSIKLYTHIKNIPYAQFMIWAFGDNWESIPLNQLHTVWNQRHGTIAKVNELKDLSTLMFQMVDWYSTLNKPV